MAKLILILIILVVNLVNGQTKVKLEGVICNFETKEPLEYVNIGVVDFPIGTITNIKGQFNLEVNQNSNYKLNISYVGYESILLPAEAINKTDTIFLKKAIYELTEVLIKQKKDEILKIGSYSESTNIVTGWSNGFGNGGERGILIKNKKNKLRINNLNFHVASNNCDTTFVRVRIREIESNLPSKELLTENLIQNISISKGWVSIDLKKHDLIFDNDIMVSIEWLKSNKKCNFLLSGNYLKGTLYYKESSATKWSIKKRFSPSIYLITSIVE